jgi:hypothetical protein
MEPEAQRIIAENLHRNFIDHAEYPRTAEIEQRTGDSSLHVIAWVSTPSASTVGAPPTGVPDRRQAEHERPRCNRLV